MYSYLKKLSTPQNETNSHLLSNLTRHLYDRAVTRLRTKDYVKAFFLFDSALSKYLNIDIPLQEADTLYSNEKYFTASIFYELCLKYLPNRKDIQEKLGLCYQFDGCHLVEKEMLREAICSFKKSLKHNNSDPLILGIIASIKHRLKLDKKSKEIETTTRMFSRLSINEQGISQPQMTDNEGLLANPTIANIVNISPAGSPPAFTEFPGPSVPSSSEPTPKSSTLINLDHTIIHEYFSLADPSKRDDTNMPVQESVTKHAAMTAPLSHYRIFKNLQPSALPSTSKIGSSLETTFRIDGSP